MKRKREAWLIGLGALAVASLAVAPFLGTKLTALGAALHKALSHLGCPVIDRHREAVALYIEGQIFAHHGEADYTKTLCHRTLLVTIRWGGLSVEEGKLSTA